MEQPLAIVVRSKPGRNWLTWVVGTAALLTACSGGGGRSGPGASPPAASLTSLTATAILPLSPGNASGNDEDPTILQAANGRLYVAWLSNRNGRQADGYDDHEIFLMSTADGLRWTDPPIQLTQNPRYSFAPSLTQDSQGAFHLAWWRVTPTPDGCVPTNNCNGAQYRVMYKRSADGNSWDLTSETPVADGPGDALPSIVYDSRTNRLLIFFGSAARDANGSPNITPPLVWRLYVSINNGTGWSAPQRLNGVNSGSTQNNYPYVVQRDDGQFLMTWMRYESGVLDVNDSTREPTTDIYWSVSSDGVNWAAPVVVSDNDTLSAIDALPSLYREPGRNQWFVVWQTAPSRTAIGSTVEIPVGGSYPADVRQRSELAGYSTRVLATPTSGIYWGVWAFGPENQAKIQYRYFTR